MEKKQAIQLISDTFNAKFDENRFTNFIKNLLNDMEPKTNRYSGQMLWDDYKDHINSYKRIGKYTDPEGEPLDVLIVEVKTIAKLERARTALRNFVIKHLKKFDKDFALVAFYAEEDGGRDWRFSFIKLEHQSYFDEEKDKVKIKEALTPAKRYSFLVGQDEQSHTAKTQLLPLLQNLANNPTVAELENAFSIEKVTDEFFNQYKDLFKKLSSHFEDNKHIKAELKKAKIENARFTKKLLGQIVFLYFLQKKGWLGVPKNEKWGKGQKRFIQDLFNQAQNEKVNFFKDKLQYLFYEALAKERTSEKSFYKRFNCRIPFLNGGLFEAEYQWQTANITIPENLFRNQEKNKAGDIGTGILDVFDRYNFTIKEDEPLDKEVAVDPEMLGKVFENMLEITERKSKGAFYTPREIVHYMCQESLIHYLDNALDGTVKKEYIETYIRKGHNALENDQRVAKKGEETARYKYILPKSIRQNADLIDQKLTQIKICDPAIGSGAFPVGLLHELVNAQLVIKPHFSDNYLKTKLNEFQFNKRETPSESRYIYRLKRHIIQESIYGVDIDASAIDIARLRLWLSLVVDEDDFDPIETLPNLDYKIVCGNSLISRYPLDMPIDNVFKEFNKKVKDPDYTNQAVKNLVGNKEIDLAYYKKLTNEFLLESSHEKKEIFRELIKEIKNAFKTVLGNKDIEKLSKARGAVENLQQSDIFGNQVGTKTQINKAKKLLAKLEKEKQDTQDGVLFKNAIEWRFEFPNLLNDNGDFVGFDVVIGNPPYFEYKLPNQIKHQYKTFRVNEIYAFFFEKSISQLLKPKGVLSFITGALYIKGMKFNLLRDFLLEYTYPSCLKVVGDKVFDNVQMPTSIFIAQKKKKKWSFSDYISGFSILEKIEFNTNLLEDFVFIQRGFEIGRNKVISTSTDYPIVTGSDVTSWGVKNIKYITKDIYLSFRKESKYFTNERILIRETGSKLTCLYLNKLLYSNRSLYSMILKKNTDVAFLKYILLLLNSEIMQYYYTLRFKSDTEIFPKIRIGQVKLLPIKSKNKIENEITVLVDYNSFLSNIVSIQKMFFLEIVNAISYELYFEQELKQANKEVLKHLTDLKPINDTMSDEEKLAIIQSEFERLYHPEHPVRFAVETLDSIEEVRIIKEALK